MGRLSATSKRFDKLLKTELDLAHINKDFDSQSEILLPNILTLKWKLPNDLVVYKPFDIDRVFIPIKGKITLILGVGPIGNFDEEMDDYYETEEFKDFQLDCPITYRHR